MIEETLGSIRVPRNGPGRPKKRPKRLIADKGYDSNPLRDSLARKGIDPIVPHRRNRKPSTRRQDGRKRRRYRHRWKVERTFAWLQNFRRLVVRWDRDLVMYRAFFHLACAIALRAL